MAEDQAERTTVWDGSTQVLPGVIAQDSLAWSADNTPEQPASARWRSAIRIAGLVFMSAVATAGAIVAAGRAIRPSAGAMTAPASVRAEPTAVPTSDAPRIAGPADSSAITAATGVAAQAEIPPAPSPEKIADPAPMPVPSDVADARYLADLQAAGITIINRDAALTAGHAVCVALAQGHSENEIVTAVVRSNPTFDRPSAAATITAAVAEFCPSVQH